MSTSKLPSYCLKKNSNGKKYAYIYLNGKYISLGPDGTKAKEKYQALLFEWLTNGKFLPIQDKTISVKEMCARFLAHAKDYYSESTELVNYKYVIKILLSLYSSIDANDFGPQKLEAVRYNMIKKGWQRSSINKQVMRVRAIFKWAEAKELIDRGMYEHLSTLAPLRKGRCPGVP